MFAYAFKPLGNNIWRLKTKKQKLGRKNKKGAHVCNKSVTNRIYIL